MGNLIDLTNQIFGDYKVTGFDNSKGKGKYYWKVKCIYCGIVKYIKIIRVITRGFFWNKRLNKWEVGIQYDKKNHYLGVYSNLEDAIKIRKDAEKKYFGKFLRKEGDLNNGLG